MFTLLQALDVVPIKGQDYARMGRLSRPWRKIGPAILLLKNNILETITQ
jgi:hypothetical protein